jgi:hypothetical protein
MKSPFGEKWLARRLNEIGAGGASFIFVNSKGLKI